MNYPVIPASDYTARVEALRKIMHEKGVDFVIGFSNLLELGIVRYYCGFAPVNESAAILIPAEGEVIVCSGQASYDYCLVKNELPNSRIAILPEIGEVSGFVYDTEGQLDFEELFKQVKAEHPYVKKVGFIGRLIFPSIIMDKLRKVFAGCEVVDMDDIHYEQRIMKSPAEVELMTKNWEMVSEVFKNVIPKIKAGMTEREVEGMFVAEMGRLGAESFVQAFAPMIASGPVNSFVSMRRNDERQIQEGETKDLNLIIKGDVTGSIGAIVSSLEKLSNENVRVKIVHTGVGTVNESDVTLAGTTGSIIIGFNVRPEAEAVVNAERDGVEIRTYRVIYECIEEIEAAMKGMLAPKFRENLLGHAEVRQTIHVPNVGTIAGSYILDGKVTRASQIRVLRDGVVIYEDKISSLRRFKDDVREVAQGYECGVGLDRFNDIKVGDILEAFIMEQIEQ